MKILLLLLLSQVHVTPDLTAWPVQAVWPDRYETKEIVVEGNCTHLGRLHWRDQENVTLTGGKIDSVLMTRCNNVHLVGVHLTGPSQVSGTSDSTITRCQFESINTQPLRIRSGSHRNVISNCRFHRSAPIPIHDVVAIQFSDSANLDNKILHCTILNYTDGIQTTHRAGEPTGNVAGLLIENCIIGHDKSVQSFPGSEEALDFKIGGTCQKPVVVRNCNLFGTRLNATSSGYAVAVHIIAQHIRFENVSIIDCDGGIFITEMKNEQGEWLRSEMHLRDVQFIDIHTSDEFNPKRTGYAMIGPNALTFERVQYINCDNQWERSKPLPQFGEHIIID